MLEVGHYADLTDDEVLFLKRRFVLTPGTDGLPAPPPTKSFINLGSLFDVDIDSVTDGQSIVYDADTGTWVPGSGGGGGGGSFPITFVQNTPLEVWNVTHALPYKPSVMVLDNTDQEILVEIRFPDANTIQIGPLATPDTGKVVYR